LGTFYHKELLLNIRKQLVYYDKLLDQLGQDPLNESMRRKPSTVDQTRNTSPGQTRIRRLSRLLPSPNSLMWRISSRSSKVTLDKEKSFDDLQPASITQSASSLDRDQPTHLLRPPSSMPTDRTRRSASLSAAAEEPQRPLGSSNSRRMSFVKRISWFPTGSGGHRDSTVPRAAVQELGTQTGTEVKLPLQTFVEYEQHANIRTGFDAYLKTQIAELQSLLVDCLHRDCAFVTIAIQEGFVMGGGLRPTRPVFLVHRLVLGISENNI
jgi:hypothetical protein